MKIGISPLRLTDRLFDYGPSEKGIFRAHHCNALADYNTALDTLMSSPDEAQDSLQKASMQFRMVSSNDWLQKCDNLLDNVRARRHCWVCGREMQGRNVFFYYYPAKIQKYHGSLISELKQDTGMIDRPGFVTICSVCGSAIENQADQYATRRVNEFKEWIVPIINNLDARVRQLEQVAHRH